MSDESRTRREFIRSTAVAGGAVLASLQPPAVHAAGSDAIGVGLVGCGGRGRGAAADAVKSSPGVRVLAIGDAFADRVAETRDRLKELGEAGVGARRARLRRARRLPEGDRDAGVDYVILATPPGFRPPHLEAAVAAGKHVFTEKPVAVDGPGHPLGARRGRGGEDEGPRRRRRHPAPAPGGLPRGMKRIHDGGIGEILAARAYWNQGALWSKPRQSSWSDIEWQLRNWLYFTWLSGDHIVEQHVHNLDVVNWAMGAPPGAARSAWAGGSPHRPRVRPHLRPLRDRLRVPERHAHAEDVPADRRLREQRRRGASSAPRAPASSTAAPSATSSRAAPPTSSPTAQTNPYVQEHIDLIASIRAGKPLNELQTVAESTLTAIMGRMSAYTGKAVTWDEALKSSETLVPASLAFGPMPVPPVPRPGQVT